MSLDGLHLMQVERSTPLARKSKQFGVVQLAQHDDIHRTRSLCRAREDRIDLAERIALDHIVGEQLFRQHVKLVLAQRTAYYKTLSGGDARDAGKANNMHDAF